MRFPKLAPFRPAKIGSVVRGYQHLSAFISIFSDLGLGSEYLITISQGLRQLGRGLVSGGVRLLGVGSAALSC